MMRTPVFPTVVTVLMLLACGSTGEQSAAAEDMCYCSDGTAIEPNGHACIKDRRHKCTYDDGQDKYKLQETTESCDEEDPRCK